MVGPLGIATALTICMTNTNSQTITFVETWKGIADAMGRSERWCRYMARRAASPLPVFKMGGIVRMNLSDRDEWLRGARAGSLVESRTEVKIAEPFLRLIA
jgi:hypothetical protein